MMPKTRGAFLCSARRWINDRTDRRLLRPRVGRFRAVVHLTVLVDARGRGRTTLCGKPRRDVGRRPN